MADHRNTSPGSPEGEPVYLTVGFLRRPHGLAGEIIMDLHTDFPERLKPGKTLLVGEKRTQLTVEGVREHQKGVLIKFNGVNTPEAAGQLRNQWVFVRASDVPPLPEG